MYKKPKSKDTKYLGSNKNFLNKFFYEIQIFQSLVFDQKTKGYI